MKINNDLILKNSEDHYTLSTYFGFMLHLAEILYGKREQYTPVGIQFHNGKGSYVSELSYSTGIQLEITLNNKCASVPNEAMFYLAHETIHILTSSGGEENTTVLEEGLAVHFSEWFVKSDHCPVKWQSTVEYPRGDQYERARKLVDKLILHDPNSIKKLRAIQPTVSKITAYQIMKMYPEFPTHIVAKLIQKFKYSHK